MEQNRKKGVLGVIEHPLTILFGVAGGGALGFFLPHAGAHLAPLGQIYVSLLSMCILPIMMTAIVHGLGRMLRTHDTRVYFRRLAFFYGFGLLIPATAGMIAAMMIRPGASLGQKALSTLGDLLIRADQGPRPAEGAWGFFESIVPHNIFQAISQGQILSIVFVCILVGLALGEIRSRGADEALDIVAAGLATFEKIFHWVTHFLAFGLFFLMAGTFSSINPAFLSAMFEYVVGFCGLTLILLAVYHLFLWRLVGGGPLALVGALKEPLFMALVTNSSVVAISPCLEAMTEKLKVEAKVADLVIPFGIIANRHGVVLLFAYTTVFMMQVYSVATNADQMSMGFIGSILVGMAAEGQGAAIAPMLEDLLRQMLVPPVLAGVVMTVAFPLVGPLQQLLTIYANCLLTVLTAQGSRTENHKPGRGRKRRSA